MSDSNYLSPGVYIQELEGPAPIVGVSTSIAAFVGMAERGPVDAPILCTSPGDYTRWFGGLMVPDEFADPADPKRFHCYLPYSVAGFFNNAGQVAYVIRVLPDEASAASEFLYDRTGTSANASTLLRGAAVGDGTGTTAATGALIMLSPVPPAGPTSIVRIGDGSVSEYLGVSAVAPVNDAVAIDLPLTQSHAAATAVSVYALAAKGANVYTLSADARAGDTTLFLNAADPLNTFAAGTWLLEVAAGGVSAIVVPSSAVSTGTNSYAVRLTQPLASGFSSAAGATAVTPLNPGPAGPDVLDVAASAGDAVLFASGGGLTPGLLIDIDPGNLASREVRTIGQLAQLAFAQPASEDWPAKSMIAPVALTASPSPAAATTLTAATAAGARVLSLGARAGIAAGTVLQLTTAGAQEYAAVEAVQGARATVGPDPGAVVLSTALIDAYPVGAAVTPFVVGAAPPAGRRATQLLEDTQAGVTAGLVSWAAGWAAGDVVRVTLADGTVAYAVVAGPATSQNLEAVTLSAPLQRAHAAGAPVVSRSPLIQVQALDAGAWGRRLAVAAQDEPTGLVARVQVLGLIGATQLRLSSLTGVQPGSYLELLDAQGGVIDAAHPLKVAAVDRATTTITLDPGSALTAAQSGAVTGGGTVVLRSREFRLTVFFYRHPDPAVPSRNTQVIQTETFRNLSMDPRHSQYFQAVIGAIGGPPRASDGRPEGSSWLIRVLDSATTQTALWAPRLGPEALVDVLPNGLTRPAQHRLDIGGDDSLATVGDATYIGADAVDPHARTGLYAIENAPNVSIVAIPGQGTPAIQAALIDFCETSKAMFAVLDPMYPDAAIADVQAQRQAFDTKYAAIYYPWLTIPDPMPANLALATDFPLPPSGHVVGVYARVDDSRGVFKAPANEVVQGIIGLTRTLVQGDQDVLNPAPSNINVIRDFRPQGRGIRVWGARCITSDDNYKYVPVRRLLIFIEQSLNVGLQDVVFEPNTPQLWASVERVIDNFLATVFASGAFAGATPEQSYFVRCDQTTMTPDDIDAGRLIALVGVAPAMPAEFVIIQIALMTATNSQ